MFDLVNDPNEMTNIYDLPNYSEIRIKLHDEYDRLRKLYDTPELKQPELVE